jgi:hypothetical protein
MHMLVDFYTHKKGIEYIICVVFWDQCYFERA